MQFSALFSYMLWHIELQFCIWLCFTILQIKFECHQFASIFVGVMPLLELRILEIHSFPHFSLPFLYARLQTGRIMVWWCPSVRPGLRPSVRHSFPHFSPTCFDILIWNFVYHFIFMHVRSSSNAINFRHLFAGVMLLFNFKLLQICSFPHFSPKCFDILSSNFVYDFVLMYHRASLSVVILLQFLLELCLFVNLEYSKYTVFRTFLLHSLTYWAEILHMTLFYCTTDQVRVSSICVNSWTSYAPFGTYNTGNTQFSALFSYTL